MAWLGGALAFGEVNAQQAPSSYAAATANATSTVNNTIAGFGTTTFPTANNYTIRYGESAASTVGLNRTIQEFVLGGQTFVRLPKANAPFDQISIKRRPNPVVVDLNRSALFFESPTAAAPATVVASNTSLFLSSSVVTSYESAINSYVVNRGAENIFTNTNLTTGTSNVERVDLILSKGFTAKNPATEGILLLERGGNDTFKYAVITGLDVFGNVSSLGPLQSFTNTSNWSNTGINFKSTVLQRNTSDALQRPSGNVAAEEVKGTFLSMQNLGVSQGTTMYGIVLFHSDVTSGMDLIGLTDVPVNSGASLDLVGGSGIFSVPTVVNNSCPTLTANLTNAFTSANLPSGTTLTWHTGLPISSATLVSNPSAVSSGLYFPAYFDANLNCYSDPGNAVRVVIINCPPTALNDQAQTLANTSVEINVRGNDTDPEGLALNNPTILTNPANGTVQVQANGNITFTPSPAFTGTTTFQYVICDQGTPSLCDTATVTVTVNNALIVANNDVSPLQNGASGGLAIPTVLTNDSLNNLPVQANQVIISPVGTVPPQLSLNTTSGAVSVNPGTPAGTYSFTYRICEVLNPTNCDQALVTISVGVAPILAVNDGNLTPINGATGGIAIPNVRSNDLLNGLAASPSNVTTALVGSLPLGLAFNPSTGSVSVLPGTSSGSYTFDYRICEVLNPTNCDTAKVTVAVGSSPIVANPDVSTLPIQGNLGGISELVIFSNDLLNNQPINAAQVILTSTPSGPLTMNANGIITVAPNTTTGNYSMVYQICEVLNPSNCDTALVTVRVVAPPIARNDVALTLVNTPVSGQVLVNDSDLDPLDVLTTTLLSGPSQGSVVLNLDGTYTYTPDANFTGNDTFCYVVSDGLSTDTACVNINVQPLPGRVNNPPVASNDIVETYQNIPVTVAILANDFDPDGNLTSTPTLLTSAQNGVGAVLPNGQLLYTPAPGFVGIDSLQYQICDAGMPILCDTAWVYVYIQPTRNGNLPPVALDDFATTVQNTPVSGTTASNDYDLDGGVLVFQQVTNPSQGSVTFLADGSYTYTPAQGFTGVDSFTYKTCDPILCDTAVVFITVTPAIKVRLFPRVYLQGALYGILLPDTLMQDKLRVANLIPSTSPYAYLSPVSATGTIGSGVLTTSGANAIVDWVFVELRDAQDPTVIVDSRAGLLQRDGDIVDIDGTSPLDFSTAITSKSYYVSVRHRNHLGVMSKTALPMTLTGQLVDFRKSTTPTFTLTAQALDQSQVVVDQGVALWAGNGLVDSKIIYQGNENDVNAVYQKIISSPLNVFSTPFFKVRGYFPEDIDLNGEVIVQGTQNDIEYIYQNIIKNHPGNVLKVPFFVISEQLP